jgi:dipeptidyl-peptidase-4
MRGWLGRLSLPTAVVPALALSLAIARAAAAPDEPLSLERLYSLPWITGTKPDAPVWSPDSGRLAFLWNDDGGNFRDVWLTDVVTAQPVRVTSMPRPENPADAGTDVDRLALVARAECDPGVTAVFWGPDGRRLIFDFHGALYSVRPGDAPQPLVATAEGVDDAAPAPRGERIAYVSGGALWVAELRGPAVSSRKEVVPGSKDSAIESFVWSADGRRLAFVQADASRVPVRGIPDYLSEETRLVPVRRPFPGEPAEARRVGMVDADGGDLIWADLGGDPSDQVFALTFAPDGRTVLVDKSDLYIKDRRLLLVDARSGGSRELLREVDPHNVTAEWWSDFAPDGKGVYFISDRDEDYHVYYQALSGGGPRRITAGPFAVFAATLSPAAKSLWVSTNRGRPEERQVERVALAGGGSRRITQAPGAHKPFPSPDGKYLADLFSDDVTPPDLYLARLQGPPAGGATWRQVTHSPLPEFWRHHWVAAKYVTFPNVDDGTLLHARLTLPPNFDPSRKHPAILGSVYSNTVHNEWGGRIYHPTWAIDQFLAQQGYVIMNVDISGSSGHGKAFRQRIREDYGGVDVEDLQSGVRYLVSQGYVDEQRVGIWGSSYGGLLTTMSLFSKPGVYRAGVAGAPATSLFHAQTGEMRTMMAPQDEPQAYAHSSPFLRSGGLRDHLLIIHGMRDDTVLYKDTVSLEQRLILQARDVDVVTLPDAPHGWDTRGMAQTRYAYKKLYEYFERYLRAP